MDDKEVRKYFRTEKHSQFSIDFFADAESYEVWDEIDFDNLAEVQGENTFTITAEDAKFFAEAALDTHPLMTDEEYAKKSEFGKPLVNSALTLAIVVGMSVADVSRHAVANLGWTDIALPAPVFNGDTLYAESTVLEKRESKSRPTQGIVTVRTRGLNQDDKVVISYERTILVPKRGHGVEDLQE